MDNKKMLGEFIYQRRKEKGLSQTQLGSLVGVSNKAVSKWETGEANPDINILPGLSRALGVTADELLACEMSLGVDKKNAENSEPVFFPFMGGFLFGGFEKIGEGEYKSKAKTKKGTPFVHINFSSNKTFAKGIVAIGFRAKGIISLGLVSVGLLSVGLVSIGLLSVGLLCLGLLASVGLISVALGAAVGAAAAGFIAVGGVAAGYISVGGIAIGYYAYTGINGIAFGRHIIRQAYQAGYLFKF